MSRLVTAVALLVGSLIPASSAAPAWATEQDPPPGVGIRLVDAPVASADDPRARVYIIDHVAPGTTIDRRVEVSNGTDSVRSISIYPAAAGIRDAAFTGAPGRTQNELSGWISVDPTSVDLPPDGRQQAEVRIRVPRNAVRGERYAAVWAEMTTPATEGGVTQVSRVGIRVYLSVGPGGAPPSDFAITSMEAARDPGGLPLIQAMVRNTGQRALDLSGELRLTDGPGQLSAGPFTAETGVTLGIGKTAPLTVLLDRQLPRGPWKARLTVVSGTERRTAHATVTFPRRPAATAPADLKDGAWVWWTLAGVALAVLVLALVLLFRRRARTESDQVPS